MKFSNILSVNLQINFITASIGGHIGGHIDGHMKRLIFPKMKLPKIEFCSSFDQARFFICKLPIDAVVLERRAVTSALFTQKEPFLIRTLSKVSEILKLTIARF